MYFSHDKTELDNAKHGHVNATALGSNVHLHTLKAVGTDTVCDPFDLGNCRSLGSGSSFQVVLRLQHLFCADEHVPLLSDPASVDVSQLLSGIGHVARMDETTLTAAKVTAANTASTVSLSPNEIKTFLVTFS